MKRIREGMALGASVEVDLVRHAGGGFAVLHDLELDHGTTGTGRVMDHGPDALRRILLRDDAGQATSEPVALLSDLCAELGRGPIGAGALLQLDLKEGAGALSAEDVRAFSAAVGPVADCVILSGGDAAAVARLSESVPGLRVGHDPCHDGAAERLAESGDDAGFVAQALRDAEEARMVYLAIPVILGASSRGFDMIAAFHDAGVRIDAYTVTGVTDDTAALCRTLMDRGVDQITTDNPEGLCAALA